MTAPRESAVLHVTLPRAATLTDVLLSPAGTPVDAAEITRARERLVSELANASNGMPKGSALRIDAYRMQMALTVPQHPHRASGPFSPSPASCRRAIGMAAVARCTHDRALAPAQAVAGVLERAMESGTERRGSAWWEEWFRRIPPGARAVVRSEAVTWATQLYGALEWSRIDSRVPMGCDYRWQCPGSPFVTLHAKVDVEASAEGRPVQLVVPTGVAGPQWAPALALPALAAGLLHGAGAVPARVVGMWPASGQVRILPIEPGTLEDASHRVIEAAWTMANQSRSRELSQLGGSTFSEAVRTTGSR